MQLKTAQLRFERIFDIAHSLDALGNGTNIAAFKRIFNVSGNRASCVVGPVLASKYKVPQDNQQYVVSITNRWATGYRSRS